MHECNIGLAFKLQVKGLLTSVRKDKQVYMHTYSVLYIHTYIHAYTHAHTHTHTHIHTLFQEFIIIHRGEYPTLIYPCRRAYRKVMMQGLWFVTYTKP